MVKPFFALSLALSGADITAGIAPGNISLEITEKDRDESDVASIVVDDKDGIFGEPEPGTKIGIVAGYVGNTRDFGVFTIDEVTADGWPQKYTISAQSVDVTSSAKQPMTQSFPKKDFPTYGDVFGKVAVDAGLSLSITSSIAGKTNEFVGQAAEDPISFASRIGEKINAGVVVKGGRLVVTEKGSGNAVSGTPLTTIAVTRPGNCTAYSRTRHAKADFGEVKATWMDRKAGELKEETASTGMSGPEFRIRSSRQNAQDAQDEAEARGKDLKRSQQTATFTINGDPANTAGATVLASGLKPTIDGEWLAKTVTHSWSGNFAYTNTVECEKKN